MLSDAHSLQTQHATASATRDDDLNELNSIDIVIGLKISAISVVYGGDQG